MAALKPGLSMIHRVVNLEEYPELPEGQYSEEFRELLDLICVEDPIKRPTVNQILNHKFVARFSNAYAEKLRIEYKNQQHNLA